MISPHTLTQQAPLSASSPSLSPFAPSCQKLGSTLKGRRRRRREGELGGPVEQQDETFCRSQCVAQHVRSLLQQNSDNNKMQSCMYRHFMKDTKGKELKHNAVETSGRLASYYIILLQSPLLFFPKQHGGMKKNIYQHDMHAILLVRSMQICTIQCWDLEFPHLKGSLYNSNFHIRYLLHVTNLGFS